MENKRYYPIAEGYSITNQVIKDTKQRPYKIAEKHKLKTTDIRMIMDYIGIRKSMVAALTKTELKKIERRIKIFKENTENAKFITF